MPLSVAVNNQYDLFVLEDLNKRIVKFDRFNQPSVAFGRASENIGQLLGPQQVAIGHNNEIFVSDPLAGAVIVFDFLGNFIREIRHPDFKEPRGIDISNQQELIVADQKSRKIFFFSDTGKLRSIFDLQTEDIIPTDVTLHSPRGKDKSILYIATPQKCLQFSRETVAPR
jgi:hypothetical protein